MGDKTKLGKIWDIILDKATESVVKPTDIHIQTENSVREMVVNLLDKKGTVVSIGIVTGKQIGRAHV